MKNKHTRSILNIFMLGLAISAIVMISLLEAGPVNEKNSEYFNQKPTISNLKPDQFDAAWTTYPQFNDRTHYQVQLNHSLYGSSLKTLNTTVKHLEPGGTYDVALVTYQDGSVVGVSSAVTLLMPPGAPTGVTVYDVASSGFKVIWQQVNSALKYRVYRFPDQLLAEVDEPANKASVTGLNPGERFNIFLTSVNSSGESYPSESQMVQLLPPPPALSIVEQEIGQTWVSIKWNAIENATAYRVIVNEAEVANLASGTLTYRIENLAVGTAVSIKMRAENSQGLSEESEAIIVQLLPATPFLAVTDISSFSCNLQWSIATGSTYYKVFENNDWCIQNLPASNNQFTVSQYVTPGMTATYTIKAGNGTGESEFSNAVVVTFTSSPAIRIEPLASDLLPDLLQANGSRLAEALRGSPLVTVYFPRDLTGPELSLEATWLDRLSSETNLRKVQFMGIFTVGPGGFKAARRHNMNWKTPRNNSDRYYLPGNLPLVRFYDSDGWLRRMTRVSLSILTPEDVFKELPEVFESESDLIQLYQEDKENFETLHQTP
ncbi:MAG: fibronectin type III domain-containing protein [Candidatus Riflebacteria bacterium]